MLWRSHKGRVHEGGKEEGSGLACIRIECGGFRTGRDGAGRACRESVCEEGAPDRGRGKEISGRGGATLLRAYEQGAKSTVGAGKLHHGRYGGERRGGEPGVERVHRGDVQKGAPV